MDDSFLFPSGSQGVYVPPPATAAWLASLPLPPDSAGTRPTSRQDWELVEQWRVLTEAITALGDLERQSVERESVEWNERAESLLPLVQALGIHDSSPGLEELAETHAALSLPLPPRSVAAAVAYDPTPSLYAAVKDLEDRVLSLSIEVHEAQNLQASLQAELEKREANNSTTAPRVDEDKTGIQKALKSALLLDRKAEEYRSRLASLQAQVKQQLGISADAVPPVGELVAQDAKIAQLKARRKELKSKLAAYGDLPSDAGMARAKVGEKKQEVAGLRKVRDKLMNEIGAGVH